MGLPLGLLASGTLRSLRAPGLPHQNPALPCGFHSSHTAPSELSVQTRRLGTEKKSALWDMRGLHPESDELWMPDWWGGRTRRSWKIFLLSPLQINPPSLKPECGRWIQITISILGKFSLRAQRPAFSRAHVFCASNHGREGKKKSQ